MKSAPKQRPAATEQNQTKQTPGQMDRSLRETVDGVPHVNTKRPCWAAKTLAEEVTELFPETRITYDNYDGRGAALDLGIDMADLNSQGREDLSQLIHLLGGAEGRIDVTPVLTGIVPPEGVAAGFDALADPEKHAKIIVSFDVPAPDISGHISA